MAKKYYWLKLKNNFFTQPRIKKLRRIAGGDTYTIIYLKMQLLSLADDGRLYFEGIEDDFVEEIALTIDEDVENVRVTIAFLIQQGLIEQVAENEYLMTETQTLIGSESESAERVRKCRARQKTLQKNETKALQCNDGVTECNTEIEIEKEKELEIDSRGRIDYQQIVDMYNEICISFPSVRSLSEARKKAIRARLKTYSTNDMQEVFNKAENSDFLKGANNRNWSANFDWMMKDANMAKILDGNYDNRTEPPKNKDGYGTSFMDLDF